MTTLYTITLALMIIADIGLVVALGVAGVLLLKRRYFTVSKSDAIEGIIWEIEDPFGSNSGFEGESLKDARQWLAKRFRNGDLSLCPCCGQTVKKYARSIHGAMCAALKYIAENPGTTSKKVLRFQGGGDYAKLVHWGLLEQSDADSSWRITDKGLQFLRGTHVVPKYVYIYNSIVFGRSEEQVDIYSCAGKDFSFEEIMAVPAEAAE